MKRKIFSALAIAAIAFVSCKKEDPATPGEPGTATIKGVITADLNQYDDTLMGGGYDPQRNLEVPPTGTNITFVVNEGDLDYSPAAGFNYNNLSYPVTIGSDGSFSVEVPAINQPVPVTVYFDEFNYNQQIYYFPQPDSVVYDMNHKFQVNMGTPVSLSVIAGGTYVYNNTYF